MSKNLSADWLNALAAQGIHTAYLARFDFASETICVWTGDYTLEVGGSGDAQLDGNSFEPFIKGVALDISTNTYSEKGSDSFELTLGVPADLPAALQAGSIQPNDFLARPAYIWRAMMIDQAGLSTPAVWAFRRIRTGAMDQLDFLNDGTQSIAKLTIESFASYISDASQSTYADQKRYDPADNSQTWASSAVNQQPISNTQSYPSGFVGRALAVMEAKTKFGGTNS